MSNLKVYSPRFLLLLIIFINIFFSCDNIDLFQFAYDNSLGPRFLTFRIDNAEGHIDVKNATVTVYLPETSNLSALVPEFTIFGHHVEYDGMVYESGTTSINFSGTEPVTLVVSLKSGYSRDFSITAAILTGLAISPDPAAVAVSLSIQFTALAQYSNGVSIDVTGETSWSSSDTLIAIITPLGAAIGVSAGAVTITGVYGTFSTDRTLEVNPLLTDIDITLDGISTTSEDLELGETLTFQAIANYIGAASADVTTSADWTSTPSDIVSVTGGVVHALAAGTATVTATYENVPGTVTINAVSRTIYYVTITGNAGAFGSLADPLSTISEAMSMATEGDQILVGAGNYTDSITIKNEVNVKGSYDSLFTGQDLSVNPSTITASIGDRGAFYGNSTISNSTIIDYFIIQGVDMASGYNTHAIYLGNYASPTISNCYIYGAGGSATSSYGIYISNASPHITQNYNITGGSTTGGKSCAIYVSAGSPVIESNYYIYGGTGSTYSFGLLCLDTTNIEIINNIISGGSSSGSTCYAISLRGTSSSRIYNNTIDAGMNNATYHYGIHSTASGTTDIVNNIFFHSTSCPSFHAIYEATDYADPTRVANNHFYTPDTVYDYAYYNEATTSLAAGIDIDTLTDMTIGSNTDGDPGFVDILSGNYQLDGTNADVTEGGMILDFIYDLVSTNRNNLAGWSKGAYEYE
ncbi:MAG: Ig-like domain-containing protein [Dehalococcoidia bacterium]|nr:Ig-like domain-containing protein [Dehalococcoidia bacterium]